jgi:hypothetical protein
MTSTFLSLFMLSPLMFRGATGGPANPLAVS